MPKWDMTQNLNGSKLKCLEEIWHKSCYNAELHNCNQSWFKKRTLDLINPRDFLKQKMILETKVFRYCSQLISKFETNGFATQFN